MHLPGKVGFVKSLRVQANSFHATCQNKVVDLLCLVKAQLRVVSSCQWPWPHPSLALIASMNLQSVVQKTLDEVFNIVHTSMYSLGFQTRLVDSLVTLVSMIHQAA